MTGVNRGLATLKRGVSLKIKNGKRRDDRRKGVRMIRNDAVNDNLNARSVNLMILMAENGRRTDECDSILLRPMTRKRGWDRKIHEKGCLPNQWRSDSQGMNKSCQKEKESSSSDHSSCATTATIDEGCTTSQLSPTRVLRAAQLKKRFADLIFKANHQSVMTQSNKGDPLKLQQERERLQREQIAEQARIEQQIKSAEALLRQREREAARIALEKMEKTVEFNDALQIMRDFESLLNCVP